MNCPNCQAESSGRFCPECGSPLKGAPCAFCGAELPTGARFCTACGEATRGSGAGGMVGWAALGVAIALFLVVFVLPAMRPATQSGAGQGSPGIGATSAAQSAPSAARTPPPLTGTPREQADRLYNRIMETFAAGDSAGAVFFLPMALEAYRMASPLDADGYFHLSLLQLTAGDPGGARSTAERILAERPDHLLGLAAAAQASHVAGDDAASQGYYRRFLEAYDSEVGRELREYVEHAPMLPALLEEARARASRD